MRALRISLVTVVAVLVASALASAQSLGQARVLASPAFPSPVAAWGGVVAWVAPSGGGHRFEIVIRRGGSTRALARTSAVGWIDGVKLGTDAHGHAIVVYSRCPHSPFASGPAGSAGSDGCLLWWAPLSGGRAQRIVAAPPNTTVGAASAGSVVFAVQPTTGHEHQPARLESSTLTSHAAHALSVPTPDGATLADVSLAGSDVAFIEQAESAEPRMSPSEVWLDAPGSAPRLLAQQVSDTVPVDDSARFFDGLTLTGSDVYAFLYANRGIYPPVPSQLERIALTAGELVVAVPWMPGGSLGAFGIEDAAFDPSDSRLVLGTFSEDLTFAAPGEACSSDPSSAKACPVIVSGPVELAEG